ncbi:hypothetical protein CSUB01_11612 [Colletotrichum sublineola]|uniref:Uncharacterized protein n=1 Tax=Colletotrichum sublineola TaxID=1173701 RepID=A0A066XGI2_COLSU|nr:hypothetical protein CSUB01_11612 [Colletotrichum sublineola]
MPVTEARRSIPDPEKKFFKLTDKGIIIATAPSVLLRLGINTIKLKVRKAHVHNKLGKGKAYSNVIYISKNNRASQGCNPEQHPEDNQRQTQVEDQPPPRKVQLA